MLCDEGHVVFGGTCVVRHVVLGGDLLCAVEHVVCGVTYFVGMDMVGFKWRDR